MGKNIALLYMSAYFAQPAPEGSKNRFLRTQTNEAAVSALWKDPASRPDKIVALCSDTVRTKPTVPAADGSGNKVPTLEYFRDEFLKQLGVQPEQLHPLRIVLFLGKLLHNSRGQTRLQFVSVRLVIPDVVNAAVNIRNIGLLVHAYASRPVCS